MGQNRKTYTEAFKKKVACEAIESKKTIQEVAAENAIAPSLVCKWKQTMMEGGFSKELKRTQKQLAETQRKLDETMVALGKRELMVEIMKKKTESAGRCLYEPVDSESAALAHVGKFGLTISEQCRILHVSRSGFY